MRSYIYYSKDKTLILVKMKEKKLLEIMVQSLPKVLPAACACTSYKSNYVT
jgi:hypothetical protein